MQNEIVVTVTADTVAFEKAMAQATESVMKFREAFMSLPWYLRFWFAVCAASSTK
jgi:hypothetical protein